MIGLTSPRAGSRWANLDATAWSVLRAQFRSFIYPNGVPTNGVDALEPNWAGTTVPAAASSITRYRIDQPGGRVCGAPVYQYLLHPTGTPNGRVLVWGDGHGGAVWYFPPLLAAERSPVVRALSLGYRVLMCPMPAFEWEHLQPFDIQVTVDGVLTNFEYHDYAGIEVDGGPLAERLFTDQFIRGANQIASDYTVTRWILGGHSGGATIAPRVAIIDSRYSGCYYFSGGMPREVGPDIGFTEYDQWPLTPAYVGGPSVQDQYRATLLGGAVPGRRNMSLGGASDVSWPLNTPAKVAALQECVEGFSEFLAPIGATYQLFMESAPAGHDITEARVNAMFSDIALMGS